MRTIVLSALLAAGVGLFAIGNASAMTAGPALGNAATNFSAVETVALVCRKITTCHRGHMHRKVCRTERVCKHRW